MSKMSVFKADKNNCCRWAKFKGEQLGLYWLFEV